MTCTTCGRPMAEGRLRCMACGTMHTQPAHTQPARAQPARPHPARNAPVSSMPVHNPPVQHVRNVPGRGFTVPPAARPTAPGLIPGERVRSVRTIGWVAIALVCAETAWGLVVLSLLAFADLTLTYSTLVAIVLLTAALLLATFAVTIVWLWRCRRNVEAFDHSDPRWRPGWSIGAWFIPLANLILVPMVIADVARNSSRTETDATRAVAAAWVWGIGQLITTCAERLSRAGLNLSGFGGPGLDPGGAATMSATGNTLSLVLSLTVAAAQIVFIKTITDQQHARIAPEFGAAPIGGWGSHRY